MKFYSLIILSVLLCIACATFVPKLRFSLYTLRRIPQYNLYKGQCIKYYADINRQGDFVYSKAVDIMCEDLSLIHI